MKTLHFPVPTLSGKFSLLSESFLTGLSELHFTWRKKYFEKYPLWFFLPSFSDIEQKISVILSNVYQLGCQNCIRRVHKSSSNSIFFGKKLVEFCLSLSDLQTEKNCFLTKIYRHVCQKCILTVHWINLRRGFLRKSFLASFRALAKNIRFFLE